MDEFSNNPITEEAEIVENQDGGQEEVVTSEEPDETAEGTEAEAAEGGSPEEQPGDDGRAARQQTHQENQFARAVRIQTERETEARVREEMDKDVAAMGLVDPYTNQPIRNHKELKAYTERHREAQIRERAEQENRPEAEIRREMEDQRLAAQKRQEIDEEKERSDKDKRQKEFLQQDAADFMSRYPNVDIMKLEQNETFREFCGSRFGREPLGDLYESYMKFTGKAAALSKAQSKAARSVGGGTGTAGSGLTAEQQKALDQWNRDNPEMKMTAKQFLSR